MTKKYLLAIVIFLVLVFMYKSLKLPNQTNFNQELPIITPSTIPSVISVTPTDINRKTYENNDFSFQYPNNISLLIQTNKENSLLQIEFENLENKTTLFVTKSSINIIDKSKIISTQEQEINGILWKNLQPQGKCYSGECEIPYFILETTRGGNNYIFRIEHTYIEPELDIILSTFKFKN